jgi:hypothetical protein
MARLVGIERNRRIHAAIFGAEFVDGSRNQVRRTGGQSKVHGRLGLRIDAGVEVDQMVVDRRRDLAGPLIGPRRTVVWSWSRWEYRGLVAARLLCMR